MLKKSVEKGNTIIITAHSPALTSDVYEVHGVRAFFMKRIRESSRICEVEEPGLFADMIEGVTEPC